MARFRSPLLATIALLVLALPVIASHVTPRTVDGAEACGTLTPGTLELVVDAAALAEGAVSQGEFEASVRLVGTVETGAIEFSGATLPVRSALVAGIDSGNLYEYPEPVTEDDGLVAPEGQPITSVSFCYVNEGQGGASSGTGASDGASAASEGSAAPADERTAPPTDTATTTSAPASSGIALLLAGLTCITVAAFLLLQPAPGHPSRTVVRHRARRRR